MPKLLVRIRRRCRFPSKKDKPPRSTPVPALRMQPTPPTYRYFVKSMPRDNSCQFHAIGHAIYGEGAYQVNQLRAISADTVIASPGCFEAALDDRRESVVEYSDWIKRDNNWGGEIELNVFSTHFNITIYVVNFRAKCLLPFNEGMPEFCVVLYSGCHYDVGYRLQDDTTKVFRHNTARDLPACILWMQQKLERRFGGSTNQACL